MAAIHPEQQYQAFLDAGRFMIQRTAGGAHVFYPRVVAPGTGAALEWVAPSGRGTVYSTSVVRQRPPAPAYNVALIELEEGPRLMSRVAGVAPGDVTIGMAVTARIVRDGGGDGDGAAVLEFIPEQP